MAKDKKTIKYEADISGFNKNIQSAEKTIKTLNNTLKLNQEQLKGSGNSTQFLSNRIDLLKEKYKEQGIVVENTRQKYEKAVEMFGENSKEAENLKNKLIQAETKQQSIANAINKTNEQLQLQSNKFITTGNNMQEFGEKATKLGEKLDNAGNKLSVLSAGVATVAVASLKSSISFESAWTGVTKTVDGTEEQLNSLRQGIIELSTQLPSTTEEIAEVSEAAGQLGIQTDNVLEFTKTMINMGNATNLSADEAATTLARFANVTKMSQRDFDKLGSVIVALGNNFATTEAEIAAMGMNLASAGTQVGMSQSQIMALATALSSVGLEAQAGGTAFSKVMVNMQLAVEKGGSELKDFASVAGMTTKQFQRAFKEDATNAIMKFVDGLSKSGEQGKSAIKILDDMGITETRLRDALLRSANASQVMEKAIKLGNDAWKENSALTEEANKRYSTTESRLKMLKNEIIASGIALGDELKPTLIDLLEEAKPIISDITNTVKAFNKLDSATKKQIISLAALVAASGPALKVGGKITTTIGNNVKSLGTLAKAIGVTRTGVTSGIKEVDSLAKTLGTLATPTSLATGAIIALCAAYAAWYAADVKQKASLGGLREEVQKQKESWEELTNVRQDVLASTMPEIESYESLANELKKITDENGKVKEGYEARAQTILGILNTALGTEYQMTGNVISQYQSLQSEIDKTILVKKAEAVLNAYQEEYATAIKEQSKATENLVGLRLKLVETAEKMSTGNAKERKEAEIQYSYIARQIGEQTTLISKYGKTITDYETLQKNSISGTADEINKSINEIGISYDNLKYKSETSIEQQIIDQGLYVQTLKQSWQEAKDSNDIYQEEILNKQLETSQKELDNLVSSLLQQTSTIQELTPEQINAWKTIADQSYIKYSESLSQLPPETQQKIQEATGVIATDISLPQEAGQEGSQATMLFSENLHLNKIVRDEIDDTNKSISNDESVGNAATDLGQTVDTNFNSKLDGWNWAIDLAQNIFSGLTSSNGVGLVASGASIIAGKIKSILGFSLPEEGPLSDFDTSMPDMIDLMVKGIVDNKSKVIKSVKSLSQEMKDQLSNTPNFQNYTGFKSGISTQVVDKATTIFTTPQIVFNVQELDEGKLQQCLNYVNKKFGSSY